MRQLVFATAIACAYAGEGPPQPQPLRLTLRDAVRIALAPDGNARVRISAELVKQADTRSDQARSALLPQVEGSFTYMDLTRNIKALGFSANLPPTLNLPERVGPFSTHDARLTGSQSVFDYSSILRFRASRAAVDQARAEDAHVRQQVIVAVSRGYLALMRATAAVEAASSDVKLAESLAALARSQKDAGTGTGIEVTRADVQLSNQRQRLLVASNQRDRAAIQLLNAIGLDVGRTVEAAQELSYTAVDPSTPEQAAALARESREDLKAQKRRELVSSLSSDAVRAERLPSLSLFGDYGTIGSSLGKTLPTRTIGFVVRVPIYDGGRRDARRSEVASQHRTEQIRSTDLERQMDLEVRLSMDNLRSAEGLVKTSEEGLRLAENELAQAERRYRAGVTTSVEVTDAQTRLERARENRIEALHEHNLARIELAAATGVINRIVQ